MTDNEDNAKYNPPSQKKQKSKKAKLSNLRVDQLVKLRDHDLHALSMRTRLITHGWLVWMVQMEQPIFSNYSEVCVYGAVIELNKLGVVHRVGLLCPESWG